MSQYEYDKDGFRFRKTKKSAWYYVRKVLMFFVVTLSLAFVYYLIFALIFSTDTEQRLKNENKMYAEELPVLESKEELLAWEEICHNISLWDYCIQFRNLVSPFPNLRVIPQNIRFFVDHNVKMLFSQSNREYEGEFSALRGYLLAKCMWNPHIDPQAVIREFCEGYYGTAAKPILTYIEEVHDAMEAAGGALSIFGGPLDAKDSWMDESHFNRYNDAALLHRVKTAVMPIWYAGIVPGYGSRQTRLDRISRFAAQARKLGLEKVEEWTITPDMFITDSIAALDNK